VKLLEREAQAALLETGLKEALAGAGSVALVSGEAGIGKTALIEAFASRHRGAARTLWGACDAFYSPRPLGPLHDMAPHLPGDVPNLLAAGAPGTRVFPAVLAEFGRVPTVAIFEDVHWADEATLDLLRYLARRIRQAPILLIWTYRDDELGKRHPLRSVLGGLAAAAVHRLPLAPLSEAAVRELAAGRRVDAAVVYRQTGGNPYFVTELLSLPARGLPANVRDAVLARAARLSPSAHAVLEAAAVIGQRIEPWLLEAVTGAEAGAAEECMAAGMLLAQDNTLAFRHELARVALLEAVSPPRRRVLHQLVLDTLQARPTARQDLPRLVHHAEAAEDHEAILAHAPAAGKQAAARGMPRAARALFALALQFADSLPLPQQIDLHESFALSAQAEPGRSATIAAYRQAIALAQEAGLAGREGHCRVRLAGVLESISEKDEAQRLLTTALAVLEPLGPSPALMDAYRVQASQQLARGEPEAAAASATTCYQMAVEQESLGAIVGARQVLGLCLLPLDHAQGRQHLEHALTLALEHRQFWMAAAIYPNLIMTYIDVFDLARAEALLTEALPFAARHDMDSVTHLLRAWLAMLRLYQGRWPEAHALAGELLEIDGLEAGSRNPALAVRARLAARQGKRGVLALLAQAASRNVQRIGIYQCARAEAAFLEGDPTRALREANDFFDVAVRNRQPGFAAELAYWRWRAGDPPETLDWMLQPFVLEIRGDWQAAAASWQALGCPYEAARALAQGDQEAQMAALAAFDRLDALVDAARLRRQLRAAGVKSIPPKPQAATRANPFGLTGRQVQVLALLAENLTNAEIAARLHISPKTVDHHVSAILAGLNVTSRQDAAKIAHEHPDLAPRS
jgi:DNA-binding CsgD family transcriptional regulator